MLKQGHYRLTQDVTNPKPDRRSKSYCDLKTWEKGWRVYVDDKGTVYFYGSRYPRSERISFYEENKINAIAAAVEPIEEGLQGMMIRTDMQDHDLFRVVELLIQVGKVTVPEVEKIYKDDDNG